MHAIENVVMVNVHHVRKFVVVHWHAVVTNVPTYVTKDPAIPVYKLLKYRAFVKQHPFLFVVVYTKKLNLLNVLNLARDLWIVTIKTHLCILAILESVLLVEKYVICIMKAAVTRAKQYVMQLLC